MAKVSRWFGRNSDRTNLRFLTRGAHWNSIGRSEVRLQLNQYLAFVGIGLLNTSVGLGIFSTLLRVLELPEMQSYALTFIVWAFPGFWLQRRFVFSAHPDWASVIRYMVAQGVSFLIGGLLLAFLVEVVRLIPEISYVMTYFLLSVILFAVSRFWVFKNRHLESVDGSSPVR